MSELERIMHIEDDRSIQEVARVALEIVGGFTVMSCSSGAQGLEQLEAFAPQLILLDVMMPDMDGPETLARLRETVTAATLPVIFMTAKVQSHEIAEYHLLSAAGVIVKPFDPMALAEQIRSIWSQTRGQR